MERADILQKATECVCGQRQQDYGTPEDNFGCIAALWDAYMGEELFDRVDVAMMLALLKIARIKTGPGTADSFVDLAGYAACGGEIATKNEKKRCVGDSVIDNGNRTFTMNDNPMERR